MIHLSYHDAINTVIEDIANNPKKVGDGALKIEVSALMHKLTTDMYQSVIPWREELRVELIKMKRTFDSVTEDNFGGLKHIALESLRNLITGNFSRSSFPGSSSSSSPSLSSRAEITLASSIEQSILKLINEYIPQQEKSVEFQAAVRIQKAFRKHLARVNAENGKNIHPRLKYWMTHQAQAHIKHIQTIDRFKFNIPLPKAAEGKTRVYLPPRLPVVLKDSGSSAAERRLKQMEEARGICDRNGYNCLVVPKALVYNDFLIESRFPMRKSNDAKNAIGYYLDNKDKFTLAIQQFAGFLCQTSLTDLADRNGTPFCCFSETSVGRYDNLMMHVEGEQGMFGLIDLENLAPKTDDSAYNACRTCIILFPYHFHEILEVVKKHDPTLEAHLETFKNLQISVLKFFDTLYEGHLRFVKASGISLSAPALLPFLPLSPTRKIAIGEIIGEGILIDNKGEKDYFRNILGTNPAETLAAFKREIPKIIDQITLLISNLLAASIERAGGPAAITTDCELLSARTLYFQGVSFDKIQHGMYAKLKSWKFRGMFEDYSYAGQIFHRILQELRSGGEIALYKPEGGGYSWIMC